MSAPQSEGQQQAHLDPELFELAVRSFSGIPAADENHTVAAAARSSRAGGKTFAALNVDHFTGGPCAELAVLGAAAAGGVLAADIATIVAVRRTPRGPRGLRDGESESESVYEVINPCGRCRQVLLDYNPDIRVIVLDASGRETAMRAGQLMAYPYIWVDGNTGRREAERTAEGI